MLVVSRKIGESILISDEIEISLLDITDGIAKIGIEAPKKIKILRKELLREIELENKESINNLEDVLKKLK